MPDSNSDVRRKFSIESSHASVVVATRDGREIGRVGGAGASLSVRDLEKMVGAELKTRGTSYNTALKNATHMEKSGDAEAAAELYRQVAGDVKRGGCPRPGCTRPAGCAS